MSEFVPGKTYTHHTLYEVSPSRGNNDAWRLCIKIQLPGYKNDKTALVRESTENQEKDIPYFAALHRLLSLFMPTERKSLGGRRILPQNEGCSFSFSLMEQDHSSSSYVILSGIPFYYESVPHKRIYHVVKRTANGCYKSIGISITENPIQLFIFWSYYTLEDQTIIIQ